MKEEERLKTQNVTEMFVETRSAWHGRAVVPEDQT